MVALTETRLELPRFSRGKVRDTYVLDDERLLMVTTDRISAFDWVLPTGIPDRGRVLTQLSVFWFERTGELQENHLLSAAHEGLPQELDQRAMVVRRAKRVDYECVVRGYLAGSAWAEYRESGTIAGEPLPAGLRESERLAEPIFTPATKAEIGAHDENIDFDGAVRLIGDRALAEKLREVSIALYEHAAEHARDRGIILADTKFELGLDEHGTLTLGDEVCTPDSSRFWPADGYQPGRAQPSFDKQYVRDWASSTGWDKTPPAPAIPDEVVARTREKYVEAYELLAGEPFEAWLTRSEAA
jgi:phosphoribosylaminoimidazole-succinocarboxamide synthase